MEVVWSFQTSYPLSFSSSSTGVVGWDEERPKEKEGKRLHEMYLLTIDQGSLYASSSSVVAKREVTTRKILALAPTPAHLDNIQIFQDKFVLGLAEDNTLFGFDLSSAQIHPLPTPCFWVREESLAGIVHTAFSDFPSKRRPEARDMGEFFLEYTSYLYENLQDFLSQDQQEFWDMADSVKESLVDGTWSIDSLKNYNFYSHLPLFANNDNHHHSNKPFSDTYGFNKVILVTTTSGKLHALSSQTGCPLWSHYAGPSVSFSSLITYRPEPHHPTHATVAYVDNTSSSSSVLTVDAFTGELISLIHVDYPIQSVELLTLPSSSSSSSLDTPPTFVAIDKNGAMHPWPPANPLSTAALEQHSSTLFLHRVHEEDVAIVGYRYNWEEKEQALVPKESWRVGLGTPGVEKIENVLTSVAGHVNLRQGLPPSYFVGDVEYTPYMNPNVVYAVTGVVSRGGEGGAQGKKEAAISVYAIDGVTGNIIYQTFHQQAAGPVHMVRDENWLCYHFWNSKQNRHELTMLELVSPPPNPTRPPVIGLLQTFILDLAVQGMGVSKTLYGATSKDIIFTSGGTVLGLVRSYLSPRRPAPENFTQVHREQMIVPYQPQLQLFPQHFLSSNRTIFGANSVTTAPSHMESSSLVFVSGHDTFFTIVAPSKAFDLLESDFNYFGLVLTVFGALILVLVLRMLARTKELNAQWK